MPRILRPLRSKASLPESTGKSISQKKPLICNSPWLRKLVKHEILDNYCYTRDHFVFGLRPAYGFGRFREPALLWRSCLWFLSGCSLPSCPYPSSKMLLITLNGSNSLSNLKSFCGSRLSSASSYERVGFHDSLWTRASTSRVALS